MINHLSIVGVGLIGASLALALKKAGYCRRITGVGRNAERLQAALKAGVLDDCQTDYEKGVLGADVVLLSVPLDSYVSVFEKLRGHIKKNAVMTDAGSAKRSVIDDAKNVFGEVPENFVPGHPIAGTERSGFEAGFAELYQGRRVILTPLKVTDNAAVSVVQKMWEAAGAIVEATDVDHHDQVLAATSHLPHLLAFALVDCLARHDDVEEIFRFAAGGFRDFTRIAAADTVMWRDISLRNRNAILAMMQKYRSELEELYHAIEAQDEDSITEIFARAKAARDKFIY